MGFNLPVFDSDAFSIGPGILYIGAVGSTPTIDIGGIRSNAELRVVREVVPVELGFPLQIAKRFVTRETVELQVTGLEWDLSTFQNSIGAGVTSAPDANTVRYRMGGDSNVANVAVRFLHSMPSGGTIDIRIWEASGSGEVTIPFSDTPHEFTFTFGALIGTTDWDGVVLADSQRLFQIEHIT